MFGLTSGLEALLIVCLLCACVFEFINGFHDTANAVATVIYTNSLKPRYAVLLSGALNFTGVMVGGVGVAMGIVKLLPVESLLDHGTSFSIVLIISILLSAIIWNLGTWYLGIPCSSSHTLVGSIIGAGMAFSLITAHDLSNVDWSKAKDIGLSLLVSPAIGFGCTLMLMRLVQRLVKDPALYTPAPDQQSPPTWIRTLLILTCSGVSFAHGSNDGQKGIGLVMLILISIIPATFALDSTRNPFDMRKDYAVAAQLVGKIDAGSLSEFHRRDFESVKEDITSLGAILNTSATELTAKEKFALRKYVTDAKKRYADLTATDKSNLSNDEHKQLKASLGSMSSYCEYAPFWVVLMISLSLGIGTMIGWKRIVVTIGSKIGKEHLSYAQGASSELVAASTIGISTLFGLPVSTTHVLSSGVAGSMVASKGLKNLRPKTLRNIMIAWLLTLPATILLSMGLFYVMRWLFL